MHLVLAILIALIAPVAAAQPLYRCDDDSGKVTYQDTPCVVLPSRPFVETPSAPGELNSEPPDHRSLQEDARLVAMKSRVRQLMKPANDRRTAQYAVNRERCEAALRIAEQCGKFAGAFYCNEQGFKATANFKPPILDNISRNKMERCALDAAKASPAG